MSRWNEYVETRIDEKVSKQELDEALKNDNILVGCEFEFILPDDTLAVQDNEGMLLWNGAVAEIEQYETSVREYEEEMEAYDKETQEYVSEREGLDEKRDELTYAVSDAETLVGDLKDEIKNLVSIIKNLESDDKSDPGDKKSAISNAKASMAEVVGRVKKENDTISMWQKEIKVLDKKIENLDTEIEDREENRYEEIEVPQLNKHTAPEYFDYMINYIGYSERDLYVEPGESADDPPEWDGGGSSDDFVEAITNSGVLNSAPFKHYNVGTYGSFSPKPGDTEWAVEDDTSLGENGVEVKNPPMDLPDFINNYLKDMFAWIGDVGYTDNSCGFHCHMSVKNPSTEIDYVKLILFTDEEWIYKAFSERAGNTYATSTRDKLRAHQPLTAKQVNDLFNKKDLIMKASIKQEHFDGISLISAKDAHVEFRFMGGSFYHKKYDEVVKTIGVYAHNLSLAMDPEYKRKEYIAKLQRITNKTEMFVLELKLQILMALKKHGGSQATATDNTMLNKMIKETQGYISTLSGSFKLDNKTKEALRNNHGFYMEVMQGLYKGFEGKLSKDLIAVGKQYI